ncbi:MAG TPA: DUF2480 family protein [Puia sp.]|jgi:hypothetical protein|nr:DUF2480 family protein [Puia sp.]
MSEEIINKVAQSGILTLDLEDYFPKEDIVLFDLKPLLFREMILKEKEFRTGLQEIDWTAYQGKIVAVTCTVDTIIPHWAYMLVAVYLQPHAKDIVLGDRQAALEQTFRAQIAAIDTAPFLDKRVVVKGCGDLSVGAFAYMEITRKLRPVVKSIMYGEPCSTVPVYKKPPTAASPA